MMITAHGGALGTGRNSQLYFDDVKKGKIKADCIEVDIWGSEGNLYLSHTPALFSKNCIKLEYALSLARDKELFINCDIKKHSVFVAVRDLAIKLNAEKFLLYTGETRPHHMKDLTVGCTYVNSKFFKSEIPLTEENIPAIKKYLDSFGNKRIKGINIKYAYATDSFIKKAKEVGLGLSLYTVDDLEELERLIRHQPDNITTNRPDIAAEIIERLSL